jgi:SAM-dependent methyltransferase
MAKDNYFIPSDYLTNPAVTFDTSEEIYWDDQRAKNAAAYQKAVYDWAERLIRTKRLTSVADLGCGTAVKLSLLQQRTLGVNYFGYDQPNAVRMCRECYDFGEWYPVNFDHPETIECIPRDLVISSDVIEHLENPDNLLECIKRISDQDTLILISTPERVRLRGDDCRWSPIKHHVREWSESEFFRYVESRGFKIMETRMLSGFDCFSDLQFFKRAVRRWLRLKTIRYSQALLIKKI